MAPVDARPLRERIWEVLQVQLEDRRNAWELLPDGRYVRPEPGEQDTEAARDGSHVTLMNRTRARLRG